MLDCKGKGQSSNAKSKCVNWQVNGGDGIQVICAVGVNYIFYIKKVLNVWLCTVCVCVCVRRMSIQP